MAFTRIVPALGLVLIALIAGVPKQARAWSTPGHRMVCEFAWNELRPEAERRVRSLLGIQSQAEFAGLCIHDEVVGADLMSLPPAARELNLSRDCPLPDSCPVREIERAMSDLTRGQGDAGAVLRLARFTGEVHQPLSVGYATDRNGIDISATFMTRKTNMHAIWNEELVAAPAPPRRAETSFDLRVITNYLDRSTWTLSPPLAWAMESYWIMRTPATGYLGNPGDLVFDEVFVAQNKLTALDQLEKAGIRLGHLLNAALGGQSAGSRPPN